MNPIMNPIKWSEKTVKKFKWYDVKLAQFVTLLATLALVTGWTAFREFVLGFQWYWYLILAIIFGLPLIKRMFID